VLVEWFNPDRNDEQALLVRAKGFFDLKCEYLHWLLHINEDFDDDLLFDAIKLIYE
jgi:hypothetical protein